MTKKQRIDKWEEKIKQIVHDYKYLSKRCQAASDAGCLDPEGHLYHAIWAMFDNMLKMVDHSDWISWHVFENECGAKKMVGGVNGKVDKITTSRMLAKLIVESEMLFGK
jgi:hypothetical protein